MIKKIIEYLKGNHFFLTFCIFSILIFLGCNKKEDDIYVKEDRYLTSFESLTSEKDTLTRGQSTIITAKTIGKNISYYWNASVGPILGYGNQVIYLTSPCCYGDVIITCEAKAGNESVTKSLLIIVLE